MFDNVLQCLVSLAMIGIATSATEDRLRDRDATVIGNNSAGIGDNSAKICNDTTDCQFCRESDPMLNSVLNRDLSNSVPGRQFPKGPVT